MKKILFVLTILLAGMGTVNMQARSYNFRYQGEVSAGVGFGIGTYHMNRGLLRTIHGVRLIDRLFVGAGIGADLYSGETGGTIIPLFLNAKGYYPLSDRVSLLASLDLGGGIGAGNFANRGGFLFDPQVGCSLKMFGKHTVDFTFGYYHQTLAHNGLSMNADALGFKVAYVW